MSEMATLITILDLDKRILNPFVAVGNTIIIITSFSEWPLHLKMNITSWLTVIPNALHRPDGPDGCLSQKQRGEGILNVSLNTTQTTFSHTQMANARCTF